MSTESQVYQGNQTLVTVAVTIKCWEPELVGSVGVLDKLIKQKPERDASQLMDRLRFNAIQTMDPRWVQENNGHYHYLVIYKTDSPSFTRLIDHNLDKSISYVYRGARAYIRLVELTVSSNRYEQSQCTMNFSLYLERDAFGDDFKAMLEEEFVDHINDPLAELIIHVEKPPEMFS